MIDVEFLSGQPELSFILNENARLVPGVFSLTSIFVIANSGFLYR